MALINIPKLFASVVDRVATTFSTRLEDAFDVFFDFGHYVDVLKNLSLKDNSITNKGNKYPLIWLVMDFPEQFGPDQIGYCLLPKIDLLIVMPTRPDLSTSERITQSFEPRLYPIYEELLNQIASSGLFLEQSVGELKHEKIDRPYWGMQDQLGNGSANLFNDYIDAVQIRGLRLNVNRAKPLNC